MSLKLFPFVPSELAARRGLKTWPRGAGWPAAVQTDEAGSSGRTPPALSSDTAADAANLRLAESQEQALAQQTGKMESTESRGMPSGEWNCFFRHTQVARCLTGS